MSTYDGSDSPLADYALGVVNILAQPGSSTAYTYQYTGDASDGVQDVSFGADGTATAYTDCSGWVAYALSAVAPLHEAVTAAARTTEMFNAGKVATYHGPSIDLDEQGNWPWARADVLTNLFAGSDGRDGFDQVANFANLQAGDLIAYATGIYADPANPDPAHTPGLIKPDDTGHTMIVVDTPHRVPDIIGLDGSAHQSSDVVAVYAVSVVDCSDIPHYGSVDGFETPQADSRTYTALADGVPTDIGAKPGGIGTGTIWFGVNKDGQAIQYRFSDKDPWIPNTAADKYNKTVAIAAVRPVDTIDLSAVTLQNGQLVVQVSPDTASELDGTSYAMPETLTGTGGLLVQGGGVLTLSAGNTFTGDTEVQGSGTTLALAADDALGADGNGVTLDDGTILRLAADMTFAHVVTVNGSATIDVAAGASVTDQGSGLLYVGGSGTLTIAGDVSDLGEIYLVGQGTALSVAGLGDAKPMIVRLSNETTLDVAGSTTLNKLIVSGTATVSVADKQMLTLDDGLKQIVGASKSAQLSVTGGGSLVIADNGLTEATVTTDHSLRVGTLTELDGTKIDSFAAGDVIDVTDLDATKGSALAVNGVTASYDPVSGRLLVRQGTREATITLPPLLTAGGALNFTVHTNGAGGTFIGLTTATGGQGSDALRATQARANGGPDGTGVHVGIISNSFNTLGGMAQDIANGALPSDTTILGDSTSVSSDEGRAMAQLVHQIAPGASIAFANAGNDIDGADLAAAINLLVQKGATVIVDDIGVFGDRVYQEGGLVDQAIDAAMADKVVFLTSATNAGDSFYEHSFSLSKKTLPGGTAPAWAFDFNLGQGTPTYLQHLHFTDTGGNITITLAWSQPGQNPAYSLDMAVFQKDAHGNDVAVATTDKIASSDNGSVRVITILGSKAGGDYDIAITGDDQDATGTFKYIVHHQGPKSPIDDPNAKLGSGTIFGHALDPNEITVGAVDYTKTPSNNGATPVSEAYSAFGQGEYLYDAAGNPLPTPLVAGKPDVSGVDGVATDVSGTASGFYGTSAAAPSVAGVVALLRQVNSSLTAAQVKSVLEASALPMGNSVQAGAGLVQADLAVALARAPVISAVAASADTAGLPLGIGHVVTFTLTASAALTVTPAADGGLPGLTLDDGNVATLDLAASTGTNLVFRATVAAGDNTANLTATGLVTNGAVVANAAGLSLADGSLLAVPGAATGLVVDATSLSTLPDVSASFTAAVYATLQATLANLIPSGTTPRVVSVAGGASTDAPVPGTLNVYAVTAAEAGSTVTVPSGYAAGYLLDGAATLSDAAGGTVLIGAAASATLIGNAGDTLFGGNAGATLVATSGAETLFGGLGANLIELGASAAVVHAQGADTLVGSTGSATIGAAGSSLYFGTSGTTLFNALGASATLVGGSGAETVNAGASATLMFAGTGALTFNGGSGLGTLVGGAGGTMLAGGSGATLYFGNGPTTYTPGSAVDTVLGFTGSLTATGGANGTLFFTGTAGGNAVSTGAGSSTIIGFGAGDSLVAAGAGNNVVAASAANATIDGGQATGSNTFFAFGADDVVTGGAGPTAIESGLGNHTLNAGGGSTLFEILAGTPDRTVVIGNFSAGADFVQFQGYGAGEGAAALATATVSDGNEVLALSDGTHVTFQGVAGLTAASFV